MEAKISSTLWEIPGFEGEMTHFTFLEAWISEGLGYIAIEAILKSPTL